MKQNEFDGLAKNYEKFRPSYPDELFTAIAATLREQRPDTEAGLLIDIGSGTGISTRLLRSFFDLSIPIIGIEPGADMIRKAAENGEGNKNIAYIAGNADNICFGDKTADLLLAAQAIQWFNRPLFYSEAARVLKPGGILAVIQNNRDWEANAFLNEYEGLLETYSAGYSRHYRSFSIEEEIKEAGGLQFIKAVYVSWQRPMAKDEFIGMANSSTKYKTAVKHHGNAFMDEALGKLLQKHFNEQEEIQIDYKSELFLATVK